MSSAFSASSSRIRLSYESVNVRSSSVALATVSNSRTTSSYPVCFSAVARLLVKDAKVRLRASWPTVLRRRGEGDSGLKWRGVGVCI